MIRHVWSVFCSSSAIDRDTNQVSLFDVVEQIQADVPALPEEGRVAIPARFQLVTLWSRGEENEAESGMTRVRLLGPNRAELIRSENEIDLREHQLRRVRMNLGGMPYAGNGRYEFIVEVAVDEDWRTLASLPVSVELRVVAGPAPVEPPPPE